MTVRTARDMTAEVGGAAREDRPVRHGHDGGHSMGGEVVARPSAENVGNPCRAMTVRSGTQFTQPRLFLLPEGARSTLALTRGRLGRRVKRLVMRSAARQRHSLATPRATAVFT